MSTTPQDILYQIQEAKAEKRKKLYLYGRWPQKLTKIPEEVFELDHLEELGLPGHAITTIPDQIKQLKQLKILDLRGNPLKQITDINGLILDFEIYQSLKTQLAPQQISGLKVKLKGDDLPPELFELPNLTRLDLGCNQLSSVPESIARLPQLTALYLYGNQLSRLPESMADFTQLKLLDLNGNQLSNLPDSITRLPQLTALNLGGNQLRSVPESIIRLQQLTELRLNNNKLSSVPESITRLNKLILISFGNYAGFIFYENGNQFDHNYPKDYKNTLKTVPESITHLPHLKTLELDGNPLESPPIEVAVQGIEKIREYFRQVEEEGVDHLYEAKLLIVGEGGAGKTTLAKKIEDRDYVLQKDEASTEGIDVITWHFPLKDVENGRSFRVNIWDFGGQEIYHATHQFFLTKRSLYALVADTRKEDTDFYYWLNVVGLLADDSPLLIIKNEKQDRHREINEQQLRGDFENLKDTLATNLATKRGWPEVLKAIEYYICKLPHVGSPLPKTWVKVREALERNERHYITFTEYLAICETHGFKKHKDKLQLSGYLHDLGVCLHFQDDPVLKHLVIIKPDWATDAVYRVLDNPTVIRKQGKFSKNDLANIWHEPKYATMHDELLQLMSKFNLCYPIEHTDSYIAPQLLTLKQPDYEWDGHDNLLLRYEYDFMPKGIMTRFIVAMHHLIAEQEHVWRSGVILQDKQTKTKAEVIEHYGKREIKVRVAGQQKKELMRLVRHELEQIHRSFKRLKYQKLVPCNCESCSAKQEPSFYNYYELLKFISDRQPKIQCRNSYKMVDVRSLIDDVESTMPVERRREGDIDPDRAPLSPPKRADPLPERNGEPDPPAKSPDDDAAQKKWFDVLRQHAGKLFVLSVFGFLGNMFTLFDLTQFQKFWFRLGLTILAALSGLLIVVWNRSQRAIWIRVGEFLLVALITLLFGGLTYQSYQANVDNSCPNVTLTVSPDQIEPGQTAQLDAGATDPDGDSLNYTWEATSEGLDKEFGPYRTPQNEYTAPLTLEAGERVTITAHVDDNQCGKQISQEVTIPILLPDN